MISPAAAIREANQFWRQSRADWQSGVVQAGVRRLSPLLFGRATLIAANAALVLLLAWRLPVETYGLFVTAIGAQVVLSRILTVGVDTGIVRLSGVSSSIDAGIEEIYSAGLTATLLVSSVLALVASGIWVVLPDTLQAGQVSWFLPSVLAGAIGLALVDLAYAYRVARVQYRLAALMQGASALFRLACTVAVCFSFPSQHWAVFLTYATASVATGSVYHLIAARAGWRRPRRRTITQVVRYSSWSVGSSLLSAANLHQGTFLLLALGAKAAAGAFGLALVFAMAISLVYVGLGDYVRSRVSHLSTPALLPRFILRWFAASSVLAAGVVPVALAGGVLLPHIAGTQWAIAVAPFYYLAGAMALQLLHPPFESACHYLLSPSLITYTYGIRLVSTGVLGAILAPSSGATGAAMAQLGGAAIGLVSLVVMLLLRMHAAGLERQARRAVATTASAGLHPETP